ncbi:sensor histidine kinase [Salinispora pacifica]|uniref:sensor histidine kinase n=1 Tax=Salinispora pacifica TaxID=351187 RepID=UPI0004758A96|nr:sensor histidine kinase [Salinispora pacifica]
MPHDVSLAGTQGRVIPGTRSTTGPTPRSGAGGGWWTSDVVWEIYYVFIAVATAALVLGSTNRPVAARAGAVATIAVALVWYAAWRRVLSGGGGATWRGYAYFAGATGLFAAGVAMANGVSLLLAMLCPQAYVILPRRRAFIAVMTVNVSYLAVVFAVSRDLVALLEAPLWVAMMTVVVSVVCGTWFSHVSDQNDDRAELIRALEASRAEVARLSHEDGVNAERQRLAADIHDTIAQGLSSVLMLMQAAEADLERSPGKARRHLALAMDTARDNLTEARALVGALTPAALDDSSLAQALRRLVDRFRSETGLHAEFAADVTGPPLPKALEVVLLRTAQESLTNVRKHARANAVVVRLEHHDGSLVLETQDDGCGRATTAQSGGYGLAAMRSRVQQMSGTVTVSSELGSGTLVRVEVPVR